LTFNNREFDPQSPEIVERLLASQALVKGDDDVAQLFGTGGREAL
jgi:hypothetical protein